MNRQRRQPAGRSIQVRSEEQGWQGAIERVLGGFALSLLVDDKHYNDVAEWVNRTHLGMRFTYYRVRRNDDAFAREPSAKSLLHKLELREHVFESWLRRELGKRFDYECVDAKQLRNVDRGITREGQVKHPGDRFEKDDRSAVGDRRRWILGFNNHDKVGAFEREAQELAKRIAGCETDIARLRGQRDRDNERRLACHELVSISWNEIDPLVLDAVEQVLMRGRQHLLVLLGLCERLMTRGAFGKHRPGNGMRERGYLVFHCDRSSHTAWVKKAFGL